MRFLSSLHFKVASGVIGTILLILATYFAWDYRQYRAELLETAAESADRVGRVALSSVLELSMIGEHPEWVQGAVERLARESRALKIEILDRSNQVRFSSDREALGRRYSLEDPGCRVCHRDDSFVDRSKFVELSGEQILRHAEAIPNGPGCRPCHRQDPDTMGVLLVDFPTLPIQHKLRSRAAETLWKAGLMISAILVVLGLLMNRLVISRVQRLTRAVSGFGPGAPEPLVVPASGNSDEIGRLSRSFQELADALQKHARELKEKEKTRLQLLERLVHSQEEERRNISMELHDELGQSLSALLLAFRANLSEREPDGTAGRPGQSDVYQDIEERIRRLIGEVHRLAWRMRPSILDDYGLENALRKYIQEVSRNTNLGMDYKQVPPGRLGRFPAWLEVTLYRIAQEAVNNIIKHAGATRASVILIREKSTVTLLVEDNGKGFDTAAAVPSSERGLGLLGMRERALLCGGTFEVESSPDGGTTIRVRIPLKSEQAWASELS